MEQNEKVSQAVDVKSWKDRIKKGSPESHIKFAMQEEIDELRAALKAQPAPTEAQGGKLLELFKLAIGTIAVHDQAEAERIAKMYRSDAVIPASVAAQGEDSARLDCKHLNTRPDWDWVECKDCRSIFTGYDEGLWGLANKKWFKSVSEAKFYKDHGRLPQDQS